MNGFQGGFGGGFTNPMSNGSGGGFMTPGSENGGEKKKNRSQTLLPVTAAMIHKAEYNETEDVFSFEGTDIHQITFVGIIRDIVETATNISYKVDDMTGEFILVKKWIDADMVCEDYTQARQKIPTASAKRKMKFLLDPIEQSRRSECRENTYVRVVGNMKSFNNGQVRSVLAFSMAPVKDFNEISFHILDVIYANLDLKKNALNNANNSMMQSQPRYDMGNDFGGGVHDAGLTGANKIVFNHISACTTEQGISIDELKQKNRNMNDQQLRTCIEWLSNEGHIYSTVDDDHYRSTSS